MLTTKQKQRLFNIAPKFVILAIVITLMVYQCSVMSVFRADIKESFDRLTTLEGMVEEINKRNSFDSSPSVIITEIKSESEPEPEPVEKETLIGNFKITGYDAHCEHCCNKSDGITASMTKAEVGRTVAMNRTDMKKLGISYGDTIYIDGIGERVVEDTGCGQGVIDVVCLNHAECYKITGNYNVYIKEVY